jgi:hypothetical protein
MVATSRRRGHRAGNDSSRAPRPASAIVAGADLVEVRVFAMHPERRNARHAGARRDRARHAGRCRDLVQRVERTAERRRLLAGDRAHRFAPRELIERSQRPR